MKPPVVRADDQIFVFGDLVVDPALQQIRRAGTVVPLTHKCFEVLLALMARRGELVYKEDLLKQVWPDTVVEENNVARNVSMLRRAIGDSTEQPFIVTISGRGYQFVAEVREVPRTLLRVTPSPAVPDLTGGAGESVAVVSSASTVPHHDTAASLDLDSGAVDDSAIVDGTAIKVAGWNQRGLMFAVAALVMALAGSLLLLQYKTSAPLVSSPRSLWRLTDATGLQTEPSWSPDGRTVAFSSDRDGNFDIWTQSLDATAYPVRLTTDPGHDWQPNWSPNGRHIAFRSERAGGGIFVVSSSGGRERKLSDFGWKPQWSPDGRQVLFYASLIPTLREGRSGYVVGVDGEPARKVLGRFLEEFTSFRLAWHPDGQRISVYGNRLGVGHGFWTVALDGNDVRQSRVIPSVAGNLRDIELGEFLWSKDGKNLFFEAKSHEVSNLWRVGVDPITLDWVAGPERLTTGPGSDVNMSLSADGRRLAFGSRSERTRLWAFPLDPVAGGTLGEPKLVTQDGFESMYDVSSDGQQLAYRISRGGKQELWGRSLISSQDRILAAAESIAAPRWSADGTQIVYRRDETSADREFAVNRSFVILDVKQGKDKVLTSQGVPANTPPQAPAQFDWSPDDSQIVTSCRTGPAQRFGLCVLRVSEAPGAEMQVIITRPDMNLFQPRYSPDGRWILFNGIPQTDEGQSTVYVSSVAGGPLIPITDGQAWNDKPRWSPDGRIVYFVSNHTGFINVWGRRFDILEGKPVGAPFIVTHFETPSHMIFPYMRPLQIAFSRESMILPITEITGAIWVLEDVSR